MPRSRATEIPHRLSPRSGPPILRTSSSDSDSLNHPTRPCRTDRSPKLSNGPSPRSSTQPNPVNHKKLGTRIADLESQLGQARDELKCLKIHLGSADFTKKEPKTSPNPVEIRPATVENQEPVDGLVETDVYEVPVENVVATMEHEIEPNQPPANQKDELERKPKNSEDDEVNRLKAMLEEREKELEAAYQENQNIKKQLLENCVKTSRAESEIEELTLRVSQLGHELETSKSTAAHMAKKLKAAEEDNEEVENAMRKLHVQTQQWRKAADAAANILAGDNAGVWERCRSMDKQNYGGGGGGVEGFVGSPRLVDDDCEREKRKLDPLGIRSFVGELWKKKGHK